MKRKKIESILILGGGTSGWMMAAALIKHCPELRITLIESEKIKVVGVGESTISDVRPFIQDYLGFNEKEWMPVCDATYKATIKFNNFKNIKGTSIYHPFWTLKEYNLSGLDWMAKKWLYPSIPISDYYSTHYIAYHMSKNLKFDRLPKEEKFSYAYHMEAIKFANFCKEKCNKKNFSHIQGTVDKVRLDEHNDIQGVRLINNKEELSADFFIDCTGFSAKLIKDTLKDPFIDITNYLLNDRAISVHLPYKNKESEMAPYTNCTALSSGWVWNIPLWSKIGTGYVYSSKFLTPKKAEKEFREYLGIERVKNIKFNHIKIRAGRQTNPWKSNCLALVLAAGFIEPLESTGLALSSRQIIEFINLLKRNNYYYDALERSGYNHGITEIFDDIFNFVLTHYVFTNRTDTPYWNYINKKNPISCKLKHIINVVDNKGIEGLNLLYKGAYFNHKSWENIVIGFELFDSIYTKLDIRFNKSSFKNSFRKTEEEMEKRREEMELQTSKMETHYQYLKKNIYNIKKE